MLILSLLTLLLGASYAEIFSINEPIVQKKLQEGVKQVAQESRVPGAVVFVSTPTNSFTAAYGTTELGKKDKPNAQDSFRIGSNTKSMISAVIVQLAQEKLLDLSDPVSKYIPGVPNGDKITVDLLLKNRSGLYDYTEAPKFSVVFDGNHRHTWTPEELLKLAFEYPPLFEPNVKFYYCNTNFILLGLIAEKMDKKPLATIFKDRLFDPLGMKHTYLPVASDYMLKKPYSHGYNYGSVSHIFEYKKYPPKMISEAENGRLKPIDYTVQSATWSWAAGGVVSTAKDLAVWIEALADGKLFNAEYYDKWLKSPELIDLNDPRYKYGYGYIVFTEGSNQFYFHNGELPGFSSYMAFDPESRKTFIIWSNLTISLKSELMGDKFWAKAYNLFYGSKAH